MHPYVRRQIEIDRDATSIAMCHGKDCMKRFSQLAFYINGLSSWDEIPLRNSKLVIAKKSWAMIKIYNLGKLAERVNKNTWT